MKKHLSVLALHARISIYKVISILLAMGTIEIGLFWLKLKRTVENTVAPNAEPEIFAFEVYLEQTHVAVVALIAVCIMTFLLYFSGCESGTCRTSYTYKRLQITEKQVFIWQAVYNGFCYFLFWGVQLFILLILWRVYRNFVPLQSTEILSNQTLFLATYRNSFFHGILPLEDGLVWMRNVIMVVGNGIIIAGFTLSHRNKIGTVGLAPLMFLMSSFPTEPSNYYYDVWFIPVMYLLFTAAILGNVKSKEVKP